MAGIREKEIHSADESFQEVFQKKKRKIVATTKYSRQTPSPRASAQEQ